MCVVVTFDLFVLLKNEIYDEKEDLICDFKDERRGM